jgi:hypothetical protein
VSTGKLKQSYLALAMMVVASLASACGSRADTAAPAAVASIVITTPGGALAVTGSMQFSATVTDDNGNALTIEPTWSVVAGGGTIDSTGLFTAGDTVGTFVNTVVATIGAVSSSSTVTVTAGALATITLTPSTTTLAIGATQQYAAVGHDAGNNVVAIEPAWSVASGGGLINGTGLFTAGTTSGTFTHTVTATSGSISGTSSVTVNAGTLASIAVSPTAPSLAIGATQQYTAVGKDANANIVPITPIWAVIASGGTINSSTGVFTAGTVAGNFVNTVRATVGAFCVFISGTASAIVNPGALADLSILPVNPTLAIGATQQFTVVGRDAYNNPVAIDPVWNVAAGGGTIDGSGLFTAGTTGGTFVNTVTATSGLMMAATSVTVTPAELPLVTITVSPSNPNVLFGTTVQYTAVGRDINNAVVAITPVWSADPAAGTIDATGLFSPKSGADGGFANAIAATQGLIVGRADVTVNCGC